MITNSMTQGKRGVRGLKHHAAGVGWNRYRLAFAALAIGALSSTCAVDDRQPGFGADGSAPPIIVSLTGVQLEVVPDSLNLGPVAASIVPVPQVPIPDPPPDGTLACGNSVGPGTCAFFTAADPSPFGLTGCAPDRVGITQLPCN